MGPASPVPSFASVSAPKEPEPFSLENLIVKFLIEKSNLSSLSELTQLRKNCFKSDDLMDWLLWVIQLGEEFPTEGIPWL